MYSRPSASQRRAPSAREQKRGAPSGISVFALRPRGLLYTQGASTRWARSCSERSEVGAERLRADIWSTFPSRQFGVSTLVALHPGARAVRARGAEKVHKLLMDLWFVSRGLGGVSHRAFVYGRPGATCYRFFAVAREYARRAKADPEAKSDTPFHRPNIRLSGACRNAIERHPLRNARHEIRARKALNAGNCSGASTDARGAGERLLCLWSDSVPTPYR